MARVLADQWHCRAIDTDDLIAGVVGVTAATYLRDQGEPLFREREVEALASALDNDDVVATGGGIVTSADARALLVDQVTLWLDCDDAVLRSRVDEVERPLLGVDVGESLARLRDERNGWYAAVSVSRIDATGNVDDVVARVNDELLRLAK